MHVLRTFLLRGLSLKGLQPDCCYWLEKRAAQGCFLAWSRLPAAFTVAPEPERLPGAASTALHFAFGCNQRLCFKAFDLVTFEFYLTSGFFRDKRLEYQGASRDWDLQGRCITL